MLVLIVILACLISFFISLGLIKTKNRITVIDIPNDRSSHTAPVPRGGGIAIIVSVIIANILYYMYNMVDLDIKYVVVITGFLAIGLLGFYSDHFNASKTKRITLQFFIAAITVYFIAKPDLLGQENGNVLIGYFRIIFNIICLVAIINFYNFMDGINGLAATQGIIAGIGIALFGVLLGEKAFIIMGLIFSAAITGFTFFNFPKAKIFMGDVGSYALGFYIASFGILDKRLFIPILLILGVFIFDASVTLFIRILKREDWRQPHKDHFYQKALDLGYSHFQITAVLSVIIFLLTTMAYLYLVVSPVKQLIIVVLSILILAILALWISIKKKN